MSSQTFTESSTIAIVGASLAGLRASETLRGQGFSGQIVVIGAEPHTPYDRPPLSKQFLAGTWDENRIQLRSAEKLDALGLDFRLGCRALSLDATEKRIELDDGSTVIADGIVLATGCSPRSLPGALGLAGVHTLRTIDDSKALALDLSEPGRNVVVIGAGFIGAEVAATATALGCAVTVVEALPVPLGKILGEEMGAAATALHTRHGVEVRTGVGVAELRSHPSKDPASSVDPANPASASHPEGRSSSSALPWVCEVILQDGSVLPADVVVVGIGVIPNTQWLEGSGLEIRDGVVADPTLHVANGVVVAGDIARWTHVGTGEEMRIEHWTNAAEQGVAAARSLLAGREAAEPYVPVPFFWSDQYETKIQMLGRPRSDDEVVVVDGSVAEGQFVALYGRGGRLTAVLGFSRPRQLMAYRQLLVDGASFKEALALELT